MKQLGIFAIVAILAGGISTQMVAQHKYIGAKPCGMCHRTEKQGKQFVIWQDGPHAKAYKTLLTDKANDVAKAKGSKKPAAETPECLSCHTTGHGSDPSMFEKTFDPKDGVQCESCHGAGSGYKTLQVMKDKAKAITAGMKEYKDEAAINALCVTCHNEKSPTYKGFKFSEKWEKVKHLIPQAK